MTKHARIRGPLMRFFDFLNAWVHLTTTNNNKQNEPGMLWVRGGTQVKRLIEGGKLKKSKLFLTAVLVLVLSAQLFGAFENVELADYNFGVKTVNGDAADVDHDGDLDFLTGQTYFNHLHFTRNDGASGLANFYLTNYAGDGKFIDFDGDGYADIANVFNYGAVGQHGLQLRQNNGSGGFTHLSTMSNTDLGSSLNNISSIAAGDYDADGDQDLVLAGSRWNQNAIVLENDGSGNFTEAAKVSWGNGQTNDAVEVQWADFDGDGDLDIMLLAQSWIPNSPLPMVWENTGSGFQPAYTEPAPGIFLWGRDASVADMDGDGDMDIVAQGQSIHGTQNSGILIYENTGAFNFNIHFIHDQTGQSIGGVRAADFDYDGDMDLMTTAGVQWGGTDNQRLMLMENVGGLNFIASAWEGAQNTGTLATIVNSIPWVGDAEGDGDLEVLTGEYYAGFLWGFNSPPPEVCDATVQTFSIIGASGSVGQVDAYTDVSLDGGLTWGPAYLSGGHPWGYISGTNSWVSINPNQTVGAGTGPYGGGFGSTIGWAYADFRIRFNIPADFSDPSMVFQVKADNEADVFLNGTYVQHISGQSGTTVDASIASALQAGENQIILRLGDYGGIWGINYRIDVTMSSCEDVSDPIVVVEIPNTAPTANAGADQTIDCVASTADVTLNGSGSDADGDDLSYHWTDAQGTVYEGASPTINLGGGTHNFTLTVSDGALEATDDVSVTVNLDITAPALTLPANIAVSNDEGVCGADVTFNVGATDACGVTSLVAVPASGSHFDVGTTTVNVTASDAAGNSSTGSFTVTVNDTEAPVIAAIEDISSFNDAGLCGAAVSFDLSATDNCAVASLVAAPASGSFFAVGTTEVTVTATDAAGNASTSTFEVTVEDNEAPTFAASTDPGMMWSPNHKYQTFDISDFVVELNDNCSDLSVADIVITHVTSDEPEDVQSSGKGKNKVDGNGDGNTTNDMVINDGSVDLRSERQGGGNGRVYTVHLAVADEHGNSSSTSFQVHVPHSKKSGAIDDGVAYTVSGSSLGKSLGGEIASAKIIPENFLLDQNYPNPFNPSTTISYGIADEGMVSLVVYDIRGSQVERLVQGFHPAGMYQVSFDASHLAAGTYLYVLDVDGQRFVKRMLLVK